MSKKLPLHDLILRSFKDSIGIVLRSICDYNGDGRYQKKIFFSSTCEDKFMYSDSFMVSYVRHDHDTTLQGSCIE